MTLQQLPDLGAVAHQFVDSLDEPLGPGSVAPPGLAEALVNEINIGLLENARAGGPLTPLVAEANFAKARSSLLRPSLRPASTSSLAIQLRRQDPLIPRSFAICATGFSPSRTRSTARRRNSGG